MTMIGKVRRMFFRQKKSVREILRLTSLSRNTVRKWLKTPVLEEPRYRRNEVPGKLTAFHETLKLALKADAHRPRHERRTACALFTQICAEGYAGSYSRVTDFVRAGSRAKSIGRTPWRGTVRRTTTSERQRRRHGDARFAQSWSKGRTP